MNLYEVTTTFSIEAMNEESADNKLDSFLSALDQKKNSNIDLVDLGDLVAVNGETAESKDKPGKKKTPDLVMPEEEDWEDDWEELDWETLDDEEDAEDEEEPDDDSPIVEETDDEIEEDEESTEVPTPPAEDEEAADVVDTVTDIDVGESPEYDDEESTDSQSEDTTNVDEDDDWDDEDEDDNWDDEDIPWED